MHVKVSNVSMMRPVALSRHCDDPEASSTNVIHVMFDWMDIIRRMRQARARRYQSSPSSVFAARLCYSAIEFTRTNSSISSDPCFALFYQRLESGPSVRAARSLGGISLLSPPKKPALMCGIFFVFCATGELRVGHTGLGVGNVFRSS